MTAMPARIIDCDTHLIEPPDLWTSRLPSKWGDLVPHVRWDERRKEEAWFMGERRLTPVAASAMAGWREYPPLFPPRWADADPVTWDAKLRLKRMDDDGIHAQVLYPNVALFGFGTMTASSDAELLGAVLAAYNDYQVDFAEEGGNRFIPITLLPFWDLDAAIAEAQRCRELGHRGVSFSQDPSAFGLPELTDRHWDRLWAALEEMGSPVNFHIASGDNRNILRRGGHPDNGLHSNFAAASVMAISSNLATISQLICGGICHRFPKLRFVSVESGVGWIPFALDALDWQWRSCGVAREHPEYDLLPSEYFRRQLYGCFWFEEEALSYAVERLGSENILYETDFPHPTSMSPGPASPADPPPEHRDRVRLLLSDFDAERIFFRNAAELYQIS